MSFWCRIGLHRWDTYSTKEEREGLLTVFTWNFCVRPDCRYSEPLLVDAATLKLAEWS